MRVKLSIFVLVAAVGFAGAAAAQPAPGADPDAALRDQCTAVIKTAADHTDKAETAADEAKRNNQPVAPADAAVTWTQAQVGVLWPLTKRYKADELNRAAQETHEQAAREVATNKRHVILAYGAMWVIAAIFLTVLWRRQQRLVGQIADLKRDLDAAVKG